MITALTTNSHIQQLIGTPIPDVVAESTDQLQAVLAELSKLMDCTFRKLGEFPAEYRENQTHEVYEASTGGAFEIWQDGEGLTCVRLASRLSPVAWQAAWHSYTRATKPAGIAKSLYKQFFAHAFAQQWNQFVEWNQKWLPLVTVWQGVKQELTHLLPAKDGGIGMAQIGPRMLSVRLDGLDASTLNRIERNAEVVEAHITVRLPFKEAPQAVTELLAYLQLKAADDRPADNIIDGVAFAANA